MQKVVLVRPKKQSVKLTFWKCELKTKNNWDKEIGACIEKYKKIP